MIVWRRECCVAPANSRCMCTTGFQPVKVWHRLSTGACVAPVSNRCLFSADWPNQSRDRQGADGSLEAANPGGALVLNP